MFVIELTKGINRIIRIYVLIHASCCSAKRFLARFSQLLTSKMKIKCPSFHEPVSKLWKQIRNKQFHDIEKKFNKSL